MNHHPEAGNPPHRKPRADARMFESHLDLPPAWPAPQPVRRGAANPAADVALLDCGLLMDAVKSRLRQIVSQPLAAAGDDPALQRVRGAVLDCADALDHLQASLLNAISRHWQIEPLSPDALVDVLQAGDGLTTAALQARHLALHDALTSLPNRRYLRRQLDEAFEKAEPGRAALCLMVIDLHGFEAIRDLHGHGVGDALLQIVAARLKRAVRAHDMVSRLGDSGFGCLLQGGLSRQQLGLLGGKLSDALAAPMQIGALTLMVRCSVALARSPDDANSSDGLLAHAQTTRAQGERPLTGLEGSDAALPAGNIRVQGLAAVLDRGASSETYSADAAPGRNGAEPRAGP